MCKFAPMGNISPPASASTIGPSSAYKVSSRHRIRASVKPYPADLGSSDDAWVGRSRALQTWNLAPQCVCSTRSECHPIWVSR